MKKTDQKNIKIDLNKLLIDSDILIDSFRKHRPSIEFLDLVDINVSWFSLMEVIAGAENKSQMTGITELFADYRVIYPNKNILNFSMEIYKKYRLSDGIGLIDSLIASTAVHHDLILVTNNIRHFRNIPGMEVLKPY